MQTVLLACWLVGQVSWASEVPPPPPLPVVVEADSGEDPLDGWARSLAESWDQNWKQAYAERSAVLPFDSHGRAEEDAPSLEPATASSVELWARFNQPVLRYRVRFTRYLYEPISGVETRADGELFWDQTSARLDLNPPAKLPKPGVNPARKDRSGQPYTVVGARRASYVVRGESVVVANHEEKTFVRHQEPPRNARNTWRARFPAISPFLKFDPADRQRTFAIDPGGLTATEERIHLRLRGLWDGWRRSYGRVEILLDPKTGRPQAMKIVDSRAVQTVYVYQEVQRGGPGEVWHGDPFRLDLKGYADATLHTAP